MAAIDLGGLPYSQIGQLQIRSRSGTIPSTIPRIGGWAIDPVAECAFVEDAGLAVPASAVSIGALKYTPDGALYVTADTTTGPFTNIGGLKVRQDGAACIITKTPSVTLDPYIGGAAYDGATQAMVVGGAGFGFILPLVTTIVPTAGVGGATFTRATTATVEDWETVVRPVLSGEVRFQGARRVRNLISAAATTQDFTSGNWIKNGAPTITPGQADMVGGTSASLLQMTAPSNSFLATDIGLIGTKPCVVSVDLKTTGAPEFWTIIVKVDGGGGATAIQVNTLLATGTWQRFSVAVPSTLYATGPNFAIRPSDGTGVIVAQRSVYVGRPVVEETTGQSNTNPSEYVSIGVLSAPYHGANVDGVKYFATQNGNTVVSNVVAEATGAAISASIIKGYLAEGARTNLCLQSEDFATTWVVTDTTVTVNQIAAPDGNTTADLLTCGVAGTDAVAQAYTATANTTQVFSLWCKRGNSDWIRVQIGGAGFANRVGCWFDITNGVVGTVENIGAGTGAAGTIKAYPNGWYRITLAGAPNNAETALTAQTLSATANGGARLNSATRYQWGGMVENNASFASSYIPTTTVAVTRNADVLTYGASGNASSSEGTVYLETTLPQISTGIVQQLINIDDGTGNQREFIAETGGTIRAQVNDGGVAQAQFTSAAILAATTIKTALTYKVNSFNAATSGVAQTKDTSGTVPAVTTIRFGDQAAGGQPIFGTIKNVMISQSQLTDTQLQALTA